MECGEGEREKELTPKLSSSRVRLPYINSFWPNMARRDSWDLRSFMSFVRAVENWGGG